MDHLYELRDAGDMDGYIAAMKEWKETLIFVEESNLTAINVYDLETGETSTLAVLAGRSLLALSALDDNSFLAAVRTDSSVIEIQRISEEGQETVAAVASGDWTFFQLVPDRQELWFTSFIEGDSDVRVPNAELVYELSRLGWSTGEVQLESLVPGASLLDVTRDGETALIGVPESENPILWHESSGERTELFPGAQLPQMLGFADGGDSVLFDGHLRGHGPETGGRRSTQDYGLFITDIR